MAGSDTVNSVTDAAGSTYTEISHLGRSHIWSGIVKGSTSGVIVNLNCNFSSSPSGAFSAEEFSGVASIGNKVINDADCTGGCTDTLAITIGTNNALVYDVFDVYGGGLGSCPTITNGGSSQITTQTLACLNGLAGGYSIGRTVYAPNRGIGTNSFAMQTSASSDARQQLVELDPPGGIPSNLGTQTACYGNCGNPAVTLTNTNSTHTVAFNQTITLLYTFQSQLNGQVLNVTTNVAKTYSNGNSLTLGIYTVLVCPSGITAFSNACPGNLQTSITINNPTKGARSLPNQAVPVSVGQWVGIALSGTFNGLDINDTNTQVAMLQTAGAIPPTISQTSTFSTTSKVGLWAYIIGNTITTPGPPVTSVACTNNFAQLDCMLPALVNGLCSIVNASCQTSSALLWIIILTFLSFLLVTVGFASAHVTKFIAAGDVFIFFFLTWFFIFAGVGLLESFVVIFFLFMGAVVFGKTARNYF
jgi:hypothetical protein